MSAAPARAAAEPGVRAGRRRGLRVAHVGRSSVRWEVGLFAAGAPLAAATGHFVHVYVDRHHRRPVALPPALTAALQPRLTAS